MSQSTFTEPFILLKWIWYSYNLAQFLNLDKIGQCYKWLCLAPGISKYN